MIIIGGSYSEGSVRPAERRLRGSGLRAAIALRKVAPALTLHTSVAESERVALDAVSGAFGLSQVEVASRDTEVAFNYFTPVSPPAIDGFDARLLSPITVEGDVVVRFGMLERDQNMNVSCRTLILDPQGETQSLPLERTAFDHLVIVANEREVRRLGATADPVAAARTVIAQTGAELVVVKSGARGARVVTRTDEHRVGARATNRVRPIGSGDVFTAAFSWSFALAGASSVEAAAFASDYTATFVNSADEPPLEEARSPEVAGWGDAPKIYLAGPFFGLGQEWLVTIVRQALFDLGADPFSPLHDVGLGGPEVARKDLDALDDCDAVLALVDDFDVGTVFEVGYAVRSDIPVVAYLDPQRAGNLTMIEGSGVEVTDDLSTAIYRSVWRGMGIV